MGLVYNEENTILRTGYRLGRVCKTCKNVRRLVQNKNKTLKEIFGGIR